MSGTDSDAEIIETATGTCPCCGYYGELEEVDQDTYTEPEPALSRKRRRSASPAPERLRQTRVRDFFKKVQSDTAEQPTNTVDGRSYIQAFFDGYPKYPYDSSSPTMLEFYRMCEHFDWIRGMSEMEEARAKIRDALTHQFNTSYGTDENDLLAWQNLCRVLELPEVPDELFRCRQVVKSTFVNIVDLVDTVATEEPVRHFETEEKLSEYTKLTGKYFPQDCAHAGGLLKFLLRYIIHPGSGRHRDRDESLPPRKKARIATRIEDVLGALSAVEAEESELSHSLAAIVADRERTRNTLVRLESLVPALDGLVRRGEGLGTNVAKTAATAERVGAGVRNLERLMGRVKAAAERVAQVSDAKASLAALYAAIDQRDWETAARHCARAMAVPKEVMDGPFAQVAIPSSDLPNLPSQTLEEARTSLLAVFRKEFDAAAIARDPVAISRFFKLFPAINCPADGLAAYSDFVLDLVSRRAPPPVKTSSPAYYTAALTALYESVAGLIDQHQPIVEKYYGSGNMHTVVTRILRECDRVVTGLYDGWEEERDISRKLTDTRTATFQVLVPASRSKPGTTDDSAPDPREIDRALGELATMAGRWALFRRFLVDRLEDDLTPSAPPTPETPAAPLKPTTPGPTTPGFGLKPITPALSPINTTLSKDPVESSADPSKPNESDPDDPHQRALTLVAETGAHTRLNTLLDSTYAPLETWHLRAALDRAHVNSSPANPQTTSNPTSTAQTSTTPDDAFFILHLTVSRALTSGSVTCVKRTVKTVKDVAERDLVGVVRRRMEDCWRTGSGGAGGGGAKGKGAGEDRVATYVTYLNDLSICAHHADRLARDLSVSPALEQGFLETEVEEARAAITGLSDLGGFRGVVKTGIDNLFTQLVRPKLRSWIPEIYRDVTYVLDDAGYSSAEHEDAVRKRFNTLTEENYRTFFALAVEVVVRPWEKYIMGMKFTELGAIRFDRDLRAIIAHLAVGDARDKFARLQQVSTLLNLDAEEDPDEFYTSSGIAWKLSASEARAVSALRA
ncbi:hypothetical protein FRC07_014213 [Ceratobasidium sp. 392]|nr:hypothetical protein FRC07_014213 [Ceratobasidium sp. 392]